MSGFRRLMLLAVVAVSCKSATTSYDYPEDLLSANYVKRSLAVREFAEKRDQAQLPLAFHLLLDRESHIRALAWDAIKTMVPRGDDLGYVPHLDEVDRIRIVARMETAWKMQRGGKVAGG